MKGFGSIAAVIAGIVIIVVASAIISVQQIPVVPTNITPPPGIEPPEPPYYPPVIPGHGSGLSEAFDLMPSVEAQGYQYVYQQEEKNTLTVTGTATVSEEPNKVDVYLGAETERVTALQSQQDNANIMAAVRAALTGIGISGDDIETTSFGISVVRDYHTQPYSIIGYRTRHILKVTSSDIDQAGQIIDAASGAGANVINSVTFGVTTDVRDDMRKDALELAGQNAQEKAQAIAAGLGVSVSGVVQASEGGVSYSPYRSYGMYEMDVAGGAEAAPTEISAGDIDVSATVTVVYVIS